MYADPLIRLLPFHAPCAMQDEAFRLSQVSVAAPPLVTVLGFAVSVTMGSGGVTETVTDCAALPPAPVHISV